MKISAANPRSIQSEAKQAQTEQTLPYQSQSKEVALKGPAGQHPEPYSLAETEAAVFKLNRTTEAFNLSLRFKIHDETDRVVVQIIDSKEKKVIKEIPPENLLKLAAQIQDMIGVLLDTKR